MTTSQRFCHSLAGVFILTLALGTVVSSTPHSQKQNLKNVLFIGIDDLRPELGTYGSKVTKSPNIDKLASQSIVFERAYCQVAVCSPSRASLLTGRRPDTNHVWRIASDEYWRDYTNATTIPQYFKENGYVSIGMGKIFHPGAPSGNDDKAYSWSLPYYHAPTVPGNHKIWESFEGYSDDQLQDGKIADNAVKILNEIKQNKSSGDNRPFFVAVGFHKPHVPWYAPSKYYDLYPPAEDIELPSNPEVPESFPPVARAVITPFINFPDVKQFYPNLTKCFTDVQASFYGKECRIPSDYTRVLRRAYYACVSYTDALVGKVVNELESIGLANDTIIVLWADHGYQLGEHNHWEKHTNFEDATHVPFMIRVPGVTDDGSRTDAFVELVDIFPSITELAGIPVPPMCPEGSNKPLACVEGTSITPLLKNPKMEWKKVAFSQYPRPSQGMTQIPNKPAYSDAHQEDVMGYTIRVEQYRFTEWYGFNRTTATPDWNDIWGTELYNHTEPVVFFNDENKNLAGNQEMLSVIKELRQMLQAGWRAALPPKMR